MKKRITILTTVAICLALVAVTKAGWVHVAGATSWQERPTPATCWHREANTGNIFPAKYVQVYDDTIQYLRYVVPSTTNTMTIATGFWELDSSSDYEPLATLAVDCTTNLGNMVQGAWLDVEWDIDSDGNVMPKE